jgi:N-acetylmuramoyl-L-alanine amidase
MEEIILNDDEYMKTKFAKNQKPIRYDKSDNDWDIEANFYVIRYTQCPAILCEWGFHTNKEDVKWLESFHGKDMITDCMILGCKDYFDSDKKTAKKK